MAELPAWRDAEPKTLWEATTFNPLEDIAEQAEQLERHLQRQIDEREQVLREKWSHDPEVQAEAFLDLKESEARVRVLRGAFFLAAFSHFELEVLARSRALDATEDEYGGSTDGRHNRVLRALRVMFTRWRERRRAGGPRMDSATDGIKALKGRLRTVIVDYDNLYTRVSQLKELRNELAHGAGFAPESGKRIKQLRLKGDVLVDEDPRLGEVILLREGFLAEATDELSLVLLWCRRACRASRGCCAR